MVLEVINDIFYIFFFFSFFRGGGRRVKNKPLYLFNVFIKAQPETSFKKQK